MRHARPFGTIKTRNSIRLLNLRKNYFDLISMVEGNMLVNKELFI